MKLTTKLVLGVTVVAGLTTATFAACATDVDMGTKNLTNVATPTESHHAATKGYVDGVVSGSVTFREVDTNATAYTANTWITMIPANTLGVGAYVAEIWVNDLSGNNLGDESLHLAYTTNRSD